MLYSELVEASVGVAFRFDIAADIEAHLERFDVIEFMVDHYLRAGSYGRHRAEAIAARTPSVAHGIRMSLGTPELPDSAYVDSVGLALDRLGAVYLSEHLAFTRAGNIEVDQLISVPLNEETLETVIENVRFVQSRIGCPLLIENVPSTLHYTDSIWSECEFLNALHRETGIQVLLDIENAYANEVNGWGEARGLIDGLAPGTVRSLRLAGGEWRNGIYVDTHAQDIPQRVLELMVVAWGRHCPREVIIERDGNYKGVSTLMSEVDRIRQYVSQSTAKNHE